MSYMLKKNLQKRYFLFLQQGWQYDENIAEILKAKRLLGCTKKFLDVVRQLVIEVLIDGVGTRKDLEHVRQILPILSSRELSEKELMYMVFNNFK